MPNNPYHPPQDDLETPTWGQPPVGANEPQSAFPSNAERKQIYEYETESVPNPEEELSFSKSPSAPALRVAPASSFADAIPSDELRQLAERLSQGLDLMQHQVDQISRAQTVQFQQTSEQLQLLNGAVSNLEKKSQNSQENYNQYIQQFTKQLDGMILAISSLTDRTGEAVQHSSEVQKSMDNLTARTTDVMRQTMDFTNTSSRRWTKELEEYRALFRDSVYDDIWKKLADIYLGILKHASRKGDPEFLDQMSYCALEPIQELMEEYGVKLQVTPVGEKRSFKRTKARGQVLTGDPEKDATVARSVMPGFVRDSIVIVPEIVETCVYQKGYQEPEQESSTGLTSTGTEEIEAMEDPATVMTPGQNLSTDELLEAETCLPLTGEESADTLQNSTIDGASISSATADAPEEEVIEENKPIEREDLFTQNAADETLSEPENN